MTPNSATTKGLAKWFTNHLAWSPGGASLPWEEMLYTDSSVAEVAPTTANMGGLSYLVYGHGVARSADWTNLNATWVGVESEPIDHQGESGLHTGEVKIGSRGHILLIDGRTYEYTSDLANVPDITGSHLYAPNQEWWHDAVTFNMDNVDSTYTYFKTRRHPVVLRRPERREPRRDVFPPRRGVPAARFRRRVRQYRHRVDLEHHHREVVPAGPAVH